MSKHNPITSLSLYHYQACPYCSITRKAIRESGVPVDLRDIRQSSEHRVTLIQEGGKQQVPCLRIESANGHVRWMYESADIIAYIRHLESTPAQSA